MKKLLLATVFGLVLGAKEGQATTYTYTTYDLPSAVIGTGNSGTFLTGINNAGQLVGDASDSAGLWGAFLDTAGTITTIASPNQYSTTQANGINNLGQVTGFFDSTDGTYYAYVYSSGTFTKIGAAGHNTFGRDINDSGTVVGDGFVSNGGILTPFTFPNGYTTSILGINDAGDMVGVNNGFGAFVDRQGMVSRIPGVSSAWGINNLGQIVGTNNHSSYVYTDGVFETISDPFANALGTVATDINDSGVIVGYYYGGELDRYVQHGFIATPVVTTVVSDVPEPSSLVVLCGLLGVASLKCRRKV